LTNPFIDLSSEKKTVAVVAVAAVLSAGLGFVVGKNSGQQAKVHKSPTVSEVFEPESKPPVAPPVVSNIRQTTNDLTDAMKYTLNVTSAKPKRNSIGMNEDATIVVRCEGSKTELFVSTPEFLSSDSQTVKVRFDDGQVESESWSGSSGGTALFSKSPRSFLQQLASRDKVVLGYQPWREAATTTVFELTNHHADFEKMLTNCK